MLTFPLVRALLQKVTVLWVLDGRVALSVEVTGPGSDKVGSLFFVVRGGEVGECAQADLAGVGQGELGEDQQAFGEFVLGEAVVGAEERGQGG
jgi:hypothetical protein